MERGICVDLMRADAVGLDVADLAEQLRSARSTWDNAVRDGGRACGTDVVRRAYTAMQDSWFAEMGVHIAVLDEAGQAIRTCVQRYRRSDDEAARGLGSVCVR